MLRIDDAHNHLQDARFEEVEAIIQTSLEQGVRRFVVNGTEPADWEQVFALSQKFPRICLPSYGVHPWKVGQVPPDWETQLRSMLDSSPLAGIGEIGLDRWIQTPDLQDQLPYFQKQWELAAEMNRPMTIHCLKAWNDLMPWIKSKGAPPRGFLLHSYSGPANLIPTLVAHGAWFSFSGWFLDSSRERAQKVFHHVPLNRLLLETDAPDMTPPAPWNACSQTLPKSLVRGKWRETHHPGDLLSVGRALATELGHDEGKFLSQLTQNFENFFLCIDPQDVCRVGSG